MRLLIALLALGVAAGCAPAEQREAVQTQNIYERYAALEHDPAFQEKLQAGSQHQHELDWMVGTWTTTIDVMATSASPAEHATTTTTFRVAPAGQIVSDDLSTIMVYDPFSARWLTSGSEPPAAAFNTFGARAPWDGRSLVFEADARLFGELFTLRQTVTKLSENEFELVNEQRVDGRYVVVDRYHYARAAAAN